MAKTAREIKGHTKNSNRGTLRGATQIEESVKKYGFGRSIVVDKNGTAIAGNHVLDEAHKRNAKVVVVESDGSALVVVKRTDLDLDSDLDKRAVELAVADNRASQVGLEWDIDRLREEIGAGADFSAFFRPDELVEEMEKQGQGGASGGTYTVKLVFTKEQSEEFGLLVEALGRRGKLELADIVLDALRVASEK